MRAAILWFFGLALVAWNGGGDDRSSLVGVDEVHEWNTIAFDVTSAGGQNAIIASRAAAMMHVAIHDALNSIDRRYEPYVHEGRAESDSAPAAAIAAAAHDVLAAAIPGFTKAESRPHASEALQKAYERAIAKVSEGPAREHGIAAGQAAAVAILTLRKDDRADAPPQYTPGTTPGAWRPHPNPVPPNPPIEDPAHAAGNAAAVLPQWAEVVPFTMGAPWQFRLPGPPALTSAEYARDFEEVKRIGGKDSTDRTPEQTEIAKFWYDGSPHHWSRIARVVAASRGLDRWDNARLLALVNMAVADGYIAGADTRYHFNLWRPVTAIRLADTDGNDATTPDPKWESLLNTPALPDYPSTHSVCGAAAATVLARFFGSDDVNFTLPSGPPFAGQTRTYTSFSAACREIGESRIYAGVHFRSACTDGIKLGKQIGRRASLQFLLPSKDQ
jgi:membrane-associated phospholipid phosphatase